MRATRKVNPMLGALVILAAGLLLGSCGVGGDTGKLPVNPPPAPTLLSVSPASGDVAGGTLITLTGTGYASAVTGVTVGGVPATAVTAVNDTTCTCLTPPGAAVGAVDVAATTPLGSAVLTGAFTYQGGGTPPTLTAVLPVEGFSNGGEPLTLTGTGFTAGGAMSNTVTVGGTPATDVVTVNDTTITCAVPAGSGGPHDVMVTNGNGSDALAGVFIYYSHPPNFLAPDVRLDTDMAGDASSMGPSICSSGMNVYVAWQDIRNGSDDVYFNRSADGGATWQGSDVRLDTDLEGAASSVGVRIACSGSNVYVVWRDSRTGDNTAYFNRSTDGGATWLASDVRIDTRSVVGDAADPRIACDGSNVYVIWNDSRNGNLDVYFNRSTDGGATWLTSDVRIDTDSAGAASSRQTELCCAGSNVYVAWRDGRNGSNDIYFNHSTDAGSTWQAADTRLDTDMAGAAASWYPKICCNGTDVHVAWVDGRNGLDDIYYNHSTDGGATWLASDLRLDTDLVGAAASVLFDIACAGSNVYVAWDDGRNGARDVYFNRSTDGGTTWLSSDLRLDTDVQGDDTSSEGHMACAGGKVYVVWADGRNGTGSDMYFNCSTDAGATWLGSDLRLDTDAAGSAASTGVAISCDGPRAYVTWMDRRNGSPFDIYFTANQP